MKFIEYNKSEDKINSSPNLDMIMNRVSQVRASEEVYDNVITQLNLAGQNALPFSFTFLLRPIILIRKGIDTAVELFLCSPVKSKKYIQAT